MTTGPRAVAQLASEFLAKAVDIILDARASGKASASSDQEKTNRWFNIETVDDRADGWLDAWRADSTVSPLVLEVLLLPHAPAATHDPPTGAADTSSAGGMVLLERWVLAHERAAVLDFGSPSSPAQLPRRPSLFESARSLEVPVIYKRTVIMLRSLYALLRTLPAHRLFLACKNNVACPFSLVYTISASPTPAPLGLDADNCGRFDFTPVQTPAGVLTASAAYLSHAAAVNVLDVCAGGADWLGTLRGVPAVSRGICHDALSSATPRILSDYACVPSAGGVPQPTALTIRRSSWSTQQVPTAFRLSPVTARADVNAPRAAAEDDQEGAAWVNRSTAPVSIPLRPSENYLDSAEQNMGGSPITGRAPFAGSSAPRASPSSATLAARQANLYAAGRLMLGAGQAHIEPGSCTAVSRLSVSPSLPFAFTPQPLSASSLASGLHPLAQVSSPAASSGGSAVSAELYGRFALALRPSSWTSPLASLARSSSLGVGLTSVSPVSDLSAMSSPPTRSCDAQLQHRPSRRNSDAAACSPDDGVDSELDQELDPLPFALEDVFNDPPGGSDASFAPCTNALTSARSDAAVGALVRLLQDTSPLRVAQGCSLRGALPLLVHPLATFNASITPTTLGVSFGRADALCELELYQTASRAHTSLATAADARNALASRGACAALMSSQTATALEVTVAALAHAKLLCEFVLVPDAARARKVVRGARSAGGERTWLRRRDCAGAPGTLPQHARLRMVYGAHTAEFALDNGADRTGDVVLRKTVPDGLEYEIGSLVRHGFVLQLRLRSLPAECGGYTFGDAALTLPHSRPACLPQPSARTTAALEAALQAQRVRCASLSNKLSELSDDLKALSDGGAQDVDKLRCCVGEVTRLLRQARLAETELQQDVLARRHWDRYDSGEETRDVLENGVRRAHMEARLGREVTREDIEVSMQIPFAERARLIGVDCTRPDAPQLRRLPFARGPDL